MGKLTVLDARSSYRLEQKVSAEMRASGAVALASASDGLFGHLPLLSLEGFAIEVYEAMERARLDEATGRLKSPYSSQE